MEEQKANASLLITFSSEVNCTPACQTAPVNASGQSGKSSHSRHGELARCMARTRKVPPEEVTRNRVVLHRTIQTDAELVWRSCGNAHLKSRVVFEASV